MDSTDVTVAILVGIAFLDAIISFMMRKRMDILKQRQDLLLELMGMQRERLAKLYAMHGLDENGIPKDDGGEPEAKVVLH